MATLINRLEPLYPRGRRPKIKPFDYPHPWINRVGGLTIMRVEKSLGILGIVEEPGTLLEVGTGYGLFGLKTFFLYARVRVEETGVELVFKDQSYYGSIRNNSWEAETIAYWWWLYWKPFKHGKV